MIALLKEANFNSANLAWDLDHAHRERSELHSKLSLQIEYLQRVNLSGNMTSLPCISQTASPV